MKQNEYYQMFSVEDSHFWYRGMKKITETLIAQYFTKKTGGKILDAGCGTGGSLLWLSNFGSTVGIDYSPLAIKLCLKRGIKNVSVAGIENLPFKDNSFDLVVSFDVLGQIQVNKDKVAIAQFYRVLKPGGILILRTAAFNWLYSYHDVAVQTKHRYTKGELQTLLLGKKFKILKTTYANMFLFPLSLVLRASNKISKNKKIGSDVKKINPILNKIFYIPLYIESLLIKWLSLPFGLSVIIVGKKLSK